MLVFSITVTLFLITISIAMIKGKGPLACLFRRLYAKRNPYTFDMKGYLRFAGFAYMMLSVIAFIFFVGGYYGIIWIHFIGYVLAILLLIYIGIKGGGDRFRK